MYWKYKFFIKNNYIFNENDIPDYAGGAIVIC